jgi:hypothetical protein
MPAMQEVGSGAIPPIEDVRVKQQCRRLYQSIQCGAQETLVMVHLVESVLRMSRDGNRRKRIYDELNSAQGAYQELVDFEAELKVRLEGIGKTQNKLAILCRQIQQGIAALPSSKSSGDGCGNLLTGSIACGALSFGALLLALIMGKGPLSLILLPFGGVMAHLIYPANSLMFQRSKRTNVVTATKPNLLTGNLSSFVSELKHIAENYGAEFGTVVHNELPVSEVKVALDRFFTVNVDLTQLETSKAMLQELTLNLHDTSSYGD